MKVRFHYFGQLRHFTEKADEYREIADSQSLGSALDDAAKDYDEGFRGIVFDESGAVRPSLMLLLNDAPVDKSALPELKDGDEVSLLTAIAGG